jgi:hypothetical protein
MPYRPHKVLNSRRIKMNISDNFRELIIKEIKYVVDKMKESLTGDEKLYFFSGVYAIIQRVINFEYDADLIYMHFILHETHTALLGRLQAIQKGGESIILLNEVQFEKLTSITEELGEKLRLNKDINSTLKKFAILSYSTTGNGHYLQQKGLLKIQDL